MGSERTQRKRAVPEYRGSFRQVGNGAPISSNVRSRRTDRTKTSIDPSQVREALSRNNGRDGSSGSGNRRRDNRGLSSRSKGSNKDENDEGFEDTSSLKSETENGF